MLSGVHGDGRKNPIRDSPSAALDPETAASFLFFKSQSAGTLLIVLPIVVVMYFATVCRNHNSRVWYDLYEVYFGTYCMKLLIPFIPRKLYYFVFHCSVLLNIVSLRNAFQYKTGAKESTSIHVTHLRSPEKENTTYETNLRIL